MSITITSEATVAATEEDFQSGKLTALVQYYTQYKVGNKHELINFGLGNSIAVNRLLGLPTLQKWQMVLDIHRERLFSKALGLSWPMEFTEAAKGLPPYTKFSSDDFKRPSVTIQEGTEIAPFIKVQHSASEATLPATPVLTPVAKPSNQLS